MALYAVTGLSNLHLHYWYSNSVIKLSTLIFSARKTRIIPRNSIDNLLRLQVDAASFAFASLCISFKLKTRQQNTRPTTSAIA